MDDRPRKDRLIQTRVPQDLESTLKDEARRRRLSVSHLIRNVLEDTFSLVDNVVSEVDRVVHDSVEVAHALKRDAKRLAATARGETAHRAERERSAGAAQPDEREPHSQPEAEAAPEPIAVHVREPREGGAPRVEAEPAVPGRDSAARLGTGALATVYGFQELILNRTVQCASCRSVIQRGAHAFLGMSDVPGAPRLWVCQDCLDTIAE